MADQLGGLLLGEVHDLPGRAEFAGEGSRPGFHVAQLLAVGVAFGVHPVQFARPARPFGLSRAGALADLPQQIGGETGEYVEAGAQPDAPQLQGAQFLLEGVHAPAQRGVLVGGQRPARRPAADDPYVEHGRRVFGGQLGVQRAVDGQRADRSETQPLDSRRESERGGALDVGAVLQAGDGGDGEGIGSGAVDMGCQLLRLPPARVLADAIRIS